MNSSELLYLLSKCAVPINDSLHKSQWKCIASNKDQLDHFFFQVLNILLQKMTKCYNYDLDLLCVGEFS